MRSYSGIRFCALGVFLTVGCISPDFKAKQVGGRGPGSDTLQTIVGQIDEKFNQATAPGKIFDARGAHFQNNDVKWGMIALQGRSADTGMRWIGGTVETNKPWDASWDDHKDLDGPTRNSAAISVSAADMTISDLHYFNVHDGVRVSEAPNWTVEYNWGEYVRDDCIENDHLQSGKVYDSLFDGCYTGISTRPASGNEDVEGAREIVEIDSVLLRLQAMPYPYKWKTKEDVFTVDERPYADTGMPFGHGPFFKMTQAHRNPHFLITNSLFLAAHPVASSKLDFPSEALIDECRNNTIVWLGEGSYPGKLPAGKFPDCFDVLTGEEGRQLWQQRVNDWHARHPDVGAARKSANAGILSFPKTF